MTRGSIRFTICTPLPESVEALSRLWASLKEQTLRDFEWVVVCQETGVGPCSAVEDLAREADFVVRSVVSKKRERAAAINKGVNTAEGEFFLILDTDGQPAPEALEKMAAHWEAIPEEERGFFISVTGLAALRTGEVYGTTFPSSPFDSNSIETTSHYGVSGRKWGFLRTEVLRQGLFPVFEGEEFVPEQLVLNRLGIRAITRYVNDIFLILDIEKKTDPIEELRRWVESPKASATFYNEFSAQRAPLVHRIKSCANYVRFSLHAGVIPDDIFKSAQKRLITFFMLWPGVFLYRRDLRRMSKAE